VANADRALLVALLASFCTASPGTAVADGMKLKVTNCADSGDGSLRAAVARAVSGDVIDLRALTCNRILLTSGEIVVPQQRLTLLGGGANKITLDGDGNSRVILHMAPASAPWPVPITATLRLKHLSVANGLIEGFSAQGGCIATGGNLELIQSKVHHCEVRNTQDPRSAIGGGAYALGNISLLRSAVFANRAGEVGGVYAQGRLRIDHSVIYSNVSEGEVGGAQGNGVVLVYSTIRDNAATSIIGGIASNGNAFINRSTISGNRADHHAGGAFNGTDTIISNSTISGNRSLRAPAGIGVDGRSIRRVLVRNSTIVFNAADAPFFDITGGGILQLGGVHYESAIVARNTVAGVPDDIWAQVRFGAHMTGENNLIQATNLDVPADTLDADPMLAPLTNNGGPTRTHALLSTSPAIDRGSNDSVLPYDQRGPGFPRVVGIRADIGAFESHLDR
jgi:hypothetical protein